MRNQVAPIALLAALAMLGVASPATADTPDVPWVLNFSGRLATSAGDFTGQMSVTFTLYDHDVIADPTEDAKHVLWVDAADVYVDTGRFHALLGIDPSNAIPQAAVTATELYLGVKVGADPEMAPRLRIVSVPFALKAETAVTLQGLAPAAFATAGHSHLFSGIGGQLADSQLPADVVTLSSLTATLGAFIRTTATFGTTPGAMIKGTYDNLQIAAGAIGAAQIADGSLSAQKLGASGCAAGQALRWGGTAWLCYSPVTSVAAGAGLIGGGASGDLLVSVIFTAPGGDHGSLETVARGDHAHDTRYFTQSQLQVAGTLNAPANPMDWTRLKGVPAGFADGVDDNTTYKAGAGISIAGADNTIAVATGGVTSSMLADGTISNVDVAADASIDGTKVARAVPGPVGGSLGVVKPDGTTIRMDAGGMISVDQGQLGFVVLGPGTGPQAFAPTSSTAAAIHLDQNSTTYTPDFLDFLVHGVPVWRVDNAGVLQDGSIPWARVTGAPQATTTTAGLVSIGDGLAVSGGKASLNARTDTTLVGIGTAASKLGLNLANANTWTASQTFAGGMSCTGCLGNADLGSATTFATVSDGSALNQFGVTNGANALVLAAGTGGALDWDSANHKITFRGTGLLNVSAGVPLIATPAGQSVDLQLGTVPVAKGGTGATDAAGARANLVAARSGANTDITGLRGLNQADAVLVGPWGTNPGETGRIEFLELASHGLNKVGFKGPDAAPADQIWTLPAADGSAGQVLITDGLGTLGWGTRGTGSVTRVATGAGLTGGPITTTGTLSIATGGVTNDLLANSSLTVVAGTGLDGGGSAALGGSVTLSNTGVLSVSAVGPLASTGGQNPAITLDGIVPVENGGTGSAGQNFVDLTTDQWIFGTKVFWDAIVGNITGNAGTVTNGLYTTGSYADPTWLTALAGAKIVGNVAGSAANVTGVVAIANGGTGSVTQSFVDLTTDQTVAGSKTFASVIAGDITGNAGSVTDGLYATGSYADPTWITSLSGGKVTGNIGGNAANVTGTVAIANGGTGSTTKSFVDLTTPQTVGGAKTFSSTITGSITGNAGTVTNGLYNTGGYADPTWITSIAGSKVTGDIGGNAANVTGTVAVANGGTGSTTKSFVDLTTPQTVGGAKTFSSTITGSITGNAGTVTNGLYNTGSYADPTWITSIAGSKVSGDIGGNAATVTNGVYTTGSYSNPAWITGIAGSKVTGNISGNAANVTGTVAIANGGTGSTTQNFVDLTTPQTVGGTKTFSSTITGSINGNAGTVTNGLYTTGSYADPTWLTSLAGTKVTGNIAGNAANVTGTVAIANGGTGSTTQNFVDLSNTQTVGGAKTFSSTVTASEFAFSTAKTGYFLASAAAFFPRVSTVGYASAGTDRYMTGAGAPESMWAAANLPQGAALTAMNCALHDSSTTNNITMDVIDLRSGTVRCGPVSTSTNTGDVSISTACSHTIDNTTNAYAIRMAVTNISTGANCSIYSCWLTYTSTNPR